MAFLLVPVKLELITLANIMNSCIDVFSVFFRYNFKIIFKCLHLFIKIKIKFFFYTLYFLLLKHIANVPQFHNNTCLFSFFFRAIKINTFSSGIIVANCKLCMKLKNSSPLCRQNMDNARHS